MTEQQFRQPLYREFESLGLFVYILIITVLSAYSNERYERLLLGAWWKWWTRVAGYTARKYYLSHRKVGHDPPTSHDFLQIFRKKVMAVENWQNKKI